MRRSSITSDHGTSKSLMRIRNELKMNGQSRIEQNRMEQNGTEQNTTEQNGIKQNRMEYKRIE